MVAHSPVMIHSRHVLEIIIKIDFSVGYNTTKYNSIIKKKQFRNERLGKIIIKFNHFHCLMIFVDMIEVSTGRNVRQYYLGDYDVDRFRGTYVLYLMYKI